MNELEQTIGSINADLRELAEIFRKLADILRKRSEELDRRARFEKELDRRIAELKASVSERHNTQTIHSLD